VYVNDVNKRFSKRHIFFMLTIFIVAAVLGSMSYLYTHTLIWPVVIGINALVALLAVRDHALVLYHHRREQ